MASLGTRSFGSSEGTLEATNGLRILFGSNQQNTWATIATFNASTHSILIRAISGHNSGGTYYEGLQSVYTHNQSANTIRTLWSGSGIGGSGGRLVVFPNPSAATNNNIILQVKPSSQYGTILTMMIMAYSGNMTLYNDSINTDFQS